MDKKTHLKVNLGDNKCFITPITSVEDCIIMVKEMRDRCLEENLSSVKIYDKVLNALEKNNYEFICIENASVKKLKRKNK